MSATLLQARPTVKRAAFPSVLDHSGIQKYVRENDFEQLCHIINRLQNLLIEANTDNDLNILGEGLENLKEATQSLDSLHCEVTLITSTEENTGKSLSEALIFASTNPQCDKRLLIESQVQYMKIASSEHVVNTNCFLFLF